MTSPEQKRKDLYWKAKELLDSYDPACVDDDYSTVTCSSLNIMSPGFGSKKLYENNMFCDWMVVAEADHVLQLTIHTLEIEDSIFCLKDFLALVDGSEIWPRFCGSYRSFTFTVRETVAFILFKSDSNGTGKGFSLTCEPIETDHTCGETFLSSVGSFNAPEINDGYREAPECTWAIFSEEDDLAQLRVTQLYIEEMYIGSRDTCDKDYLEVNNQDDHIGTYCGTEPPALIETTSRAVFVTLHTDWIGDDQSFLAHYAIADADLRCGGIIIEHESRVTSPDRDNDGAYDTNLNCKWLIVANKTLTITLGFTPEFRIEESPGGDCAYDSLTITDYNTKANTKLCGYKAPEPVFTASNKLLVEFNSDMIQTGDKGFGLNVFIVDHQWIYLKNSTTIMSPGFINNKHYPNEMFYVWVFDLEENHALQLSFHNFDLEDSELCKKDVLLLSVYIAPAELMDIHLCGSIRPCTLVLEPRQTEEIAITFKSDSGGTYKGFNLTCKAIKISNHCGETFVHGTTEHGIGNFPATPIRDVYHHISDCTWTIVSAIELYAWNLKQLYITEMSIGVSEICEMAYLKVYGLKNFTKIFCGTTPPPIFEVNTQALFVTLHMDWTVADHSFDAYYYIGDAAHETGGIIRLTHTMNIIWLAGISSGGYDEDIDRKWFIVARHIAIIRIIFTGPFEIEQSPDGNCTQDSLTITDYSSKDVLRLCGYQRPAPMHYYSKMLIVGFYSDSHHTEDKGFTLNFRRLYDHCEALSGNVISSPVPRITDNYAHDDELYCKWEMYLYEDNTLQITFLFIDIEESKLCSKGYVELYEEHH